MQQALLSLHLIPNLKDILHHEYKDTQKTQRSWREIEEALGCSQDEAMTAGFLARLLGWTFGAGINNFAFRHGGTGGGGR